MKQNSNHSGDAEGRAIQEATQRILQSSLFAASTIDRTFLEYLIRAAHAKRELKETTIAIEVFGKSADFDPSSDSIVRSHNYQLRKKIETYYLTEGKTEKIRLVIPKGHYEVKWVHATSEKFRSKLIRPVLPLYSIPLVVLLLVAVFWLSPKWISYKNRSFKAAYERNPIWNDFLRSNLPILLVLGDYYVFKEPFQKHHRDRFYRDAQINSDQDLIDYLNRHPEEKADIQRSPLRYLGKDGPGGIMHLLPLFIRNQKAVTLKYCSELLWEDITRNNILFIGHFKTIGQLDFVFTDMRIKYQLFPSSLFVTDEKGDTTKTITLPSFWREGIHNDYAVVAKLRGPSKNTIMVITSFSSFGKIRAAEKLSDPAFPSEIQTDTGIQPEGIPNHFEILMEIRGVLGTGFNDKILYFIKH